MTYPVGNILKCIHASGQAKLVDLEPLGYASRIMLVALEKLERFRVIQEVDSTQHRSLSR